MGGYPIVLDLTGRRCVVAGGGALAERRVLALLAAGAEVTVVHPALGPALAVLAAAGRIRHVARAWRATDLDVCGLAFAATEAEALDAAVARDARARGVWVNAADDPARCDFFLPALVRRGALVVAVATGGGAPALARAVREELERYFTPEYATLAEIAAEARRELRAAGRPVTAAAWRAALDGDVRRLIVERGREAAKRHLLARLEGAACA